MKDVMTSMHGRGQRKNLASPKGFDDLLNKGSGGGGGGGVIYPF